MIELPEVLTLARQMNGELKGRQIESVSRGNSPHKFAFYNLPPEAFEEIPVGKTVGKVAGDGMWIFMRVVPGYTLLAGSMGGRILFHQTEETVPKKHHLMLRFQDRTCLTVTIQMWGFLHLVEEKEAGAYRNQGVSPLSKIFTYGRFKEMLDEAETDERMCIKKLLISGPGISGIGNGYLQDILFRAGIHPTRKVVDIAGRERQKLCRAIRRTMKEATELGGRDEERDLYNRPGGYSRTLNSKARGNPCPQCGTPIEKIQYLGGASYFCPKCQV